MIYFGFPMLANGLFEHQLNCAASMFNRWLSFLMGCYL